MISRILVVDDDYHIQVFLQKEGFDIYQATDGVDALSVLETQKVDMVILDIMMPNMDGWELCSQLRQDYDFPLSRRSLKCIKGPSSWRAEQAPVPPFLSLCRLHEDREAKQWYNCFAQLSFFRPLGLN